MGLPWTRTRGTGIAALLVASASLALAAPTRAQETLDEAPEVTMQKDAEAQASPADADRKARELFEQGRAAFAEGQYREAWGHFRDAYKLSKRPELLYNVGQSADRMRMDREALEAFRLYLKKLPDAPNRREVEARVRFLEEQLRKQGASTETPDSLDDGGAGGEQEIDAYAGARAGASDPSTQAAAAEAEAETAEDDAIAPDGMPTRKGWYFRLDLGLGLLADSLSNVDASIGSVTASGLFVIGHDVMEGFVVGGMITGDWALSPTATSSGGAEADIERANLSMLGAVAEYYLAPRRNGWHLAGGVGFVRLELSDMSATVGTEDAGGLGFLVGGGHEWTVDRAWAIGAFGRVILALMSTDSAHHTAFVPSITFSAVWY